MNAKERFNAVLNGKIPDRLPVVTHHIMDYYLKKYQNGITNAEFFKKFGIDEINWYNSYNAAQSDNWRIEEQKIDGTAFESVRYTIVTPKGNLTTVIQYNEYTSWMAEPFIKKDSDIELLDYMPQKTADVEQINAQVRDDIILRGTFQCFDVYGQPGCWQDAACLYGIENLILKSYDDPGYVHELLERLCQNKLVYANSLKGAMYDIMELGGGDASSTVISPTIFEEFVAPYDSRIIEAAHNNGQKVVYHTCGGMMPILENLISMKPDALETLTPPDMGGDVDLAKAKKIIDGRACMIGGFDQGHFFTGCTHEQTRLAVRKCFEDAGQGGGYILCPSDHFFDADDELLFAFADEAIKCIY